MRNIRLSIAYEGTRYQGWQRQEGKENTIQGRLESLLSRMCGEEVELKGSGRTDAGVHASGQVANFHTRCELTLTQMQAYINRYLPEDIAVTQVQEVPERFHSRLCARGKRYAYRVVNAPVPNVFWRRYAHWVQEPLDAEAMREAAAYLLGEHDFQSFTSAKKGRKSTVRRLDEITVSRQGELITLAFQGNGFLYHMVRILTGTLLEVGLGERDPRSMPEILAARSREAAGALAPAKGLMLEAVFYEKL